MPNGARALVCTAIRNQTLLSFRYEDGYERVVEPHLCGRNTADHDALSAWLVRGHSQSDARPGWRDYLLAEMRSVELLKDDFDGPRKGFNPIDPRFVQVYCRLKPPQ